MSLIGLVRSMALSLAVLLSAGPAAAADSSQAARPSPRAEDDQILVLFHDERDQRIPVGDPNSPYRRRGDYGNSTWSERVASDLADDYGLERVAQWPVTALGVHCVVYKVPSARSVNSVIEDFIATSGSRTRNACSHSTSCRPRAATRTIRICRPGSVT
ncbi:MAG: hypothetical protein U1E83_02455 [Methylotetracoccus sp.]